MSVSQLIDPVRDISLLPQSQACFTSSQDLQNKHASGDLFS